MEEYIQSRLPEGWAVGLEVVSFKGKEPVTRNAASSSFPVIGMGLECSKC